MKAPMSREMEAFLKKPGNGHDLLLKYLEERKDEHGNLKEEVKVTVDGKTFSIQHLSGEENATEGEGTDSLWTRIKRGLTLFRP